jgi:mono/diheme cytochrome c family protein
MRGGAGWLGALVAALGCAGGEEQGLSEAALRGQAIYQNVCIACHAADPAQDGTLGPAIAGSSRELLEAKVVRGEYPPGHAPRRPTLSMPVFAYLEGDVPALAAYLNEAR